MRGRTDGCLCLPPLHPAPPTVSSLAAASSSFSLLTPLRPHPDLQSAQPGQPEFAGRNSLWLRAGELAVLCKDGSGEPDDSGVASALQPGPGWLGGTQCEHPGFPHSLSTFPCMHFPPVCGTKDQGMKRQSGLQ